MFMKTVLAAAALAATMVVGSTAASFATPTNPVVSPIDGSFSGTAPTSGFDFFSFAIPLLGSYTVNGIVSTASSKVSITAFDFFSAPLATSVIETGTKLSTKIYTLDPITLAAGTYYVGVKATGGNNSSATGYSGTLSVSSVPLPTSVALFGTAIAGLGLVGAARRKAQKASATA
ncbi:hypothetical protein [Lichenifustis flavocetrariae]|uniref:PEP-CTERM sorting domain-containing protein n=1 Tax=Lichenifustis flavocetrariae TaxID=2949735 RepID=A0AA41YZ52_9HYPH|nr:hypothetical protein [Lichenifustis flavocetrariae]MCW6509960.1 hypothetical protein [Lichenifustis flavocetrariae]